MTTPMDLASTDDAAETGFLDVHELDVHYTSKGRTVRANDRVSLQVPRGSTYALIGESGCGKSTVGRAIDGGDATRGAGSLVWTTTDGGASWTAQAFGG